MVKKKTTKKESKKKETSEETQEKKPVKKEAIKKGFLETSQKNLISYILGIVGVVMAFFSPIIGVILGIIGLSQTSKEKSRLQGMSKRLNIIAIIIGVVIFILTVVLFSTNM